MKLYLAHPLEERKWIRELELYVEKETGLELVNPFYDTERTDIKDIDAGIKSRYDPDLDYAGIVYNDLNSINNCQGIVAFLNHKRAIGTMCEIWHCGIVTSKPVYIISEDANMHPWIRFIIDESEGKCFNNWNEFIEYFKGLNL